jgi:AcrR family transcriptional regulator
VPVLFIEHGFNGLSTDQLVAASGGSKATLYRYFPSKEALFEAIIDDIAAPALDTDGEDTWDDVDLEEGLRLTDPVAVAPV